MKSISVMCLVLSFLMLTLPAKGASHNLDELTLEHAQRLMNQGELTAEALTLYYLDKIANIDQTGIELNAISQLNQHVIRDAKRLDTERQKGKVRGPLHGIPIVLKDNIDTADGMATTAGSLALRNNYPQQDAYLVKLLRQAGVIILAKANMSEWANARSFYASGGWSGLYGQTKNPYDPSRSPCGSSAGSAVVVAANLAMLAVGTETNGSLVCPGSVNGVVAIKPTVGLISRSGVIPIAHSFDTPGPLARTVTDAVLLLQAMVAKDPADAQSVQGESDYLRYLDKNSLRGKKIGLVTNLITQTRLISDMLGKQIVILENLGAEVVKVPLTYKHASWDSDKTKVFLQELKSGLQQYLKSHNLKDMQSIADLIRFNQEHSDIEMQYFSQEIFEMAERTQGTADKDYLTTLSRLKTNTGELGIDATLKKFNLDFFISPTLEGPAPSIDLIYGKGAKVSSAAAPAAIAGYPHITVPMGMVHNMPVGLSFFGGRLSEGQLIGAAYAYEQATLARRKPIFL
jgi:amidase